MIKSVDPSPYVGLCAVITVVDDETDEESIIELQSWEIVPLVTELLLTLKNDKQKP